MHRIKTPQSGNNASCENRGDLTKPYDYIKKLVPHEECPASLDEEKDSDAPVAEKGECRVSCNSCDTCACATFQYGSHCRGWRPRVSALPESVVC